MAPQVIPLIVILFHVMAVVQATDEKGGLLVPFKCSQYNFRPTVVGSKQNIQVEVSTIRGTDVPLMHTGGV